MAERNKARVKALVIEFSRGGQSGLYLPYKSAELKEGEAAVFSSFYTRALIVAGSENLKEEIRDGVADATAHLQEGQLVLHLSSNDERRIASHSKDRPNATYVIDPETDSVYYGTIGTDPKALETKIKDFASLMPPPRELNQN